MGHLVSIITPVYNGKKFLDLAVQSILAQTYPHWELLLIDDGSKDNSYQRILEWAGRDERIKALCHEGRDNRGVSATRNLGIHHARGEYIALLDCDDEWLADKLEKQTRLLAEYSDAVLVYSKAISVDEDGVELANSRHLFKFPAICGTAPPVTKDAVVRGMIRDTVWMPALTVMMKADKVRSIGGFDETLKLQVEDHLLFTLLAASGPICFIDQILAKYRVHSTSYTQTTQWKYSMLEYYDRLYGYLPKLYHCLIATTQCEFASANLVSVSSIKSTEGRKRLGSLLSNNMLNKHISLWNKLYFFSLLTLKSIVQFGTMVINISISLIRKMITYLEIMV